MEATIFIGAAISCALRLVIEAEASRSPLRQVVYTDCSTHGFIREWQLSRHERRTAETKSRSGALYTNFVCYVTEHQTVADADVCFALYCARIPVLTMQSCESTSPLLLSPCQLANCLHTDKHESVTMQQARLVSYFFNLVPVGSTSFSNSVVVLEGGDGCGKATQTTLLMRRLQPRTAAEPDCVESPTAPGTEKKVIEDSTCRTLDFPYERGLYGGLIRVLLSGKRGNLSELDPRLFSLVYTLNRYGCLPELRYWLQHGRTVVLDRYYTANFGHQASKLPLEERKAFILTQEKVEVDLFGLPRASQVFYLDLSPNAALEAMRQDGERDYLDIHETASGDYKERVRMSYRWCCDNLAGWHMIPCCDKNGSRLSREEIHQKIYALYCAR